MNLELLSRGANVQTRSFPRLLGRNAGRSVDRGWPKRICTGGKASITRVSSISPRPFRLLNIGAKVDRPSPSERTPLFRELWNYSGAVPEELIHRHPSRLRDHGISSLQMRPQGALFAFAVRILASAMLVPFAFPGHAGIQSDDQAATENAPAGVAKPIHQWRGLWGTWQYQNLTRSVCMRGPFGTVTRCYDRFDVTSPTLSLIFGNRWNVVGEHFLGGQNYNDEGDIASDSNFKSSGYHLGVAYIASTRLTDWRFELRHDERTRKYCLPVRLPWRIREVCDRASLKTYGSTLEMKSFVNEQRFWFVNVAGTYWLPTEHVGAFEMAKGDIRWAVGVSGDARPFMRGKLEGFLHQGRDLGTGDRYWGIGLRLPLF